MMVLTHLLTCFKLPMTPPIACAPCALTTTRSTFVTLCKLKGIVWPYPGPFRAMLAKNLFQVGPGTQLPTPLVSH